MEVVEVVWAVLAILLFGCVGGYVLNFNTLQLPGRARRRIKELPPGSMGWPVIGETFRLKQYFTASKPFAFYAERMSKWGDIFMTHFAGSPMLCTVSPAVAKEILSQEHSQFVTKYPAYAKKLLGRFSLLQLHGDTHSRMRRLLQPFLQPEKLKGFMGTLERLITTNMERCEKEATFSGCELCRQTTFDIIAKLMMSLDRGPQTDAMLIDFETWRSALRTLPIPIPGSAFAKGLQARARMGAVIENICKARQQEGTVGNHSDLVDSLLTEHETQGGPALTAEQVTDLVFTTLAAGLETSSTVMVFAMMYLLQHPDVLRRMRKENLDLRDKVGANKPLAWADIKSLDFTAKVINEVLRVVNPVMAVYREALQDTKLLGFFVPAGLRTQVSIIGIHRDPRNYKDPEKFDPHRWQTEKSAATGLTFLPFGYGARICPGMELGRLEISLFLHHLACKYEWETSEPLITNYYPLPEITNKFPIRFTRL